MHYYSMCLYGNEHIYFKNIVQIISSTEQAPNLITQQDCNAVWLFFVRKITDICVLHSDKFSNLVSAPYDSLHHEC